MSSYESSWNDRYLFEPIGPSLGRQNIITEDTEDKIMQKESVYKQQTAETTSNSFLGQTIQSSRSFGITDNNDRVLDTRRSSNVGTFQDSSSGSQRSSLDNGTSFTQSSASYSSYKQTNINGKESSSSSHYEQHSDSRDRNSSASTTAANMLERQRRESSRKSSLAGPMPLWLSPADEEINQSLMRKASTISSSSRKSVSKIYIA